MAAGSEKARLIETGKVESPFLGYTSDSSATPQRYTPSINDFPAEDGVNVDEGEDRLEDWQVAVNLVKGSIGTGILGLPLAMKHAGVLAGPVILSIMGLFSLHNMHLLVNCSRAMTKRDPSCQRMDYGELTNVVFSHYGGKWKKFASRLVNFFLCLVQFGFCCVYVLFVADNIYSITGKLLTVRIWASISLPAFLILSFFDHLTFISYISFISNFLALFGLAGVLADVIPKAKDPSSLPLVASFSTLALFFGQSVFAFEGIGVILPVEKKAKNQHHFVFVMYISIIFVVLLYLVVAIFGYLAYPDTILGSVTLNLKETPFNISLQAVYAAAIYCTYFIQFYVPMTIMIPVVTGIFESPINKKLIDVLFRTVCVVATYAVAIGIPQLGSCIALVGSMAGSAVLFVFPCLLHTLVIWEDRGKFSTKLSIFKNAFIMFIGVIGAIAGTYAAIDAISKSYEITPARHKPNSDAVKFNYMVNFTSLV